MANKRIYDTDGPQKSAAKREQMADIYDAPFIGYINLNLSPEQKAAFDKWLASASPADALESFAADGIHFSLKIEPKSRGFLASATQRRKSSPNAGYVVTARAGGAQLAFWRVVYCVSVLSRAERWTDVQPLADPDRW